MAIQQVIWNLDTCDCIILLDYDTNTDTFTPNKFIQTCSFHIGIADITQRHSTINTENTRKNQAYQIILDHAPASFFTTRDDGSVIIKKGIKLSHTVQGTVPNRTFTLTVSGITLTPNQINTAQTFLDNRFGAGKVTLVNVP